MTSCQGEGISPEAIYNVSFQRLSMARARDENGRKVVESGVELYF